MSITTHKIKEEAGLKYRNFGADGTKISALGFGCMRLPEYEKDGKWHIDEEKAIPMLHRAMEQGGQLFRHCPLLLQLQQ